MSCLLNVTHTYLASSLVLPSRSRHYQSLLSISFSFVSIVLFVTLSFWAQGLVFLSISIHTWDIGFGVFFFLFPFGPLLASGRIAFGSWLA